MNQIHSQAENMLINLPESLSACFFYAKQAADPLVILGSENHLEYLNPMTERLIGSDSEAMAGLPFSAILAPAEAVRLQGEPPKPGTSLDTRVLGKNGEEIPVSLIELPLPREAGAYRMMMLKPRQPTSSQGDTRTNQLMQARLQQMVSSNVIGILYWRLDDEITDANDAFLNMLGYTRDELEAGKIRLRELTPPEFRESDMAVIRRIRHGEVIHDYIKQYYHKDGHRVDVQIGVAMLEGSEEEAICFVQDISERIRTERELEKGLNRERLNRRVLEITSQPLGMQEILSQVAGEVGRFFQADRCILTRLEWTPQHKLKVELSGQYCAQDELKEVRIEDIPPEILNLLKDNLPPDHAFTFINTPNRESYRANLAQRLSELPMSEEKREEALHFCSLLLFERYRIQSNLRAPIRYRGTVYGTIVLHQCYQERVWTD